MNDKFFFVKSVNVSIRIDAILCVDWEKEREGRDAYTIVWLGDDTHVEILDADDRLALKELLVGNSKSQNQQKMLNAMEVVKQGVLTFSSETWNSREENVTEEEAELAAIVLVERHLFYKEDERIFLGDVMDGGEIGWAIDTAREIENDY